MSNENQTQDTLPAAQRPGEAALTDDPRLWLEEVEGERALAQVRTWNARSLEALQADPRYAAMEADALAIVNATDKLAYGVYRGGAVYNFWQDETHVRGLVRRTSLDSYLSDAPEWEPLLDVDALSETEGENWVYKGSVCLPPAHTRCLLTLSRGGKDAAVRREWDHDAKAFVEGGFHIPEAKGSAVWVDADTLLVATDWDAHAGRAPEDGAPSASMTESGYPLSVRLLRRGQALGEAVELFSGESADVSVSPARIQTADGPLFFAWRAETFYESSVFWLPMTAAAETPPAPVRVPIPRKSSLAAVFKGQMVVSLQEDWTPEPDGPTHPKGALVSFDWTTFAETGALGPVRLVYAPGPRASLSGLAATQSKLLVAVMENVRDAVDAYDVVDGAWVSERLALPDDGSIGIVSAQNDSDIAFLNYEGYLTPDTLTALNVVSGARLGAKSAPARFAAEGLTVRQFEAASSDGTAIPYFVVHRADITLNGDNPALLYGYGGFEIPLTPSYSGLTGKLWLEEGGVYVVANIRGGGEFGPQWHQAGLKTNRQIIYDDFIAVAEDLQARGITKPERLGIYGGSNGGLLVGVMYAQRPELFGAVVCAVPLLDMLRFDKLLAGASWVGEYGDPDIPEERAFLAAISPYHNVAAEQDYPPILFVTSTKDDRVHPGHARKMAALLEELGHEFKYYENIDGGHSAAANLQEAAKRTALLYTFLKQELVD